MTENLAAILFVTPCEDNLVCLELIFPLDWTVSGEHVLKLAMLLQDPHLMSCACYAMSQLAYLSPDQVLPLVFERFQVKLPNPAF